MAICRLPSWMILRLLVIITVNILCSTMGQKTRNVKNFASYVGTQIKISCTLKVLSEHAIWRYSSPGSLTSRLVLNRTTIIESFKGSGLYLEQSSDLKSFNLIIESVQGRHAGTYICYENINTPIVSTELIVLKSPPTCFLTVIGERLITSDVISPGSTGIGRQTSEVISTGSTVISDHMNKSDAISVGSTVHYSCEFDYFGTMSVRLLQWRDTNGQNASNSVTVERQNNSWTTFGLSFSLVARPPSILPYTFTACMYIDPRANCSAIVGSGPQFFSWISSEINVTGVYTDWSVSNTRQTVESSISSRLLNKLSEFTVTPISSHVVTSGDDTRHVSPNFKWPLSYNTIGSDEIQKRLVNGIMITDIPDKDSRSIFTTYTGFVIGLIVCSGITLILLIHCSYRSCQNRKRAQVVPIDNRLEEKDASITPSDSVHVYSTLEEENPYEEVVDNSYARLLRLQLNPMYRPTVQIPPMYSSMLTPKVELSGSEGRNEGMEGIKDMSPAVSDEKIHYIYTSVPNLDGKTMIAGGEGEYLTFMTKLDQQNKNRISLSQPFILLRDSI